MSEVTEAIIQVEPEVRLGSLSISDPTQLVARASELATALADIINKQQLYSVIKDRRGGPPKKYVKCEGWTTMGAMLGVVPCEEYCRRLPEDKGFEAKVRLIRVRDGGEVGSASAECTHDESNWASRDSYSLRSMALTRATSKAFRLSFSWIIKLAGFEPTPSEEMSEDYGSVEAAQAVGKEKVEKLKKKLGMQSGTDLEQQLRDSIEATKPKDTDSMFYIWHNESQTATITGAESLKKKHRDLLKKFWDGNVKAIVVNAEQLEELKYIFEQAGTRFAPLKENTVG